MVKVYVSLVKKGIKALDEVPAQIREQVKKALEEEQNA